MMPNMTVMAPKNKWELSDMLKYAIRQDGPVAIRYPRGEAYDGLREYRDPVCRGKAEVIVREGDIALLAVGSMVKIAEKAREILKKKGFRVTLVNMRFVKPLDTGLLDQLAADHRLFVTLEENVKSGGFGEAVLAEAAERKEKWPPVQVIAIEDRFVPQGSIPELLHRLGMDAEAVADRTQRWFEENNDTDRREE